MGAAEQPQMLVSDRELPDVSDRAEQRAGVGHLLVPAEPQAHAMLTAEPVERLDLRKVVTELRRLGREHSIMAAGCDRLHQSIQLAARPSRLHRPAMRG